jgi:hypothetical protein
MSEPRQSHSRDPVQLPPVRRQRQHRIDLVPHLIEGTRIDQAPAVRRLRVQATVSYPAAHGPRTPPHPLRRFVNREHGSIVRPHPDVGCMVCAERRSGNGTTSTTENGSPATIAPNRPQIGPITTKPAAPTSSRNPNPHAGFRPKRPLPPHASGARGRPFESARARLRIACKCTGFGAVCASGIWPTGGLVG